MQRAFPARRSSDLAPSLLTLQRACAVLAVCCVCCTWQRCECASETAVAQCRMGCVRHAECGVWHATAHRCTLPTDTTARVCSAGSVLCVLHMAAVRVCQ